MSAQGLGHLSCPPLLFSALLPPPTKQTNSPSPLHASPLYLMPSLTSHSLPLSLSPQNWPSCPSALPQFPQLPALPKREAPKQYGSQVKRKNRLRSQWTSGAQRNNRSLFLLHSFSAAAGTGKDKPFGEVTEGRVGGLLYNSL